MKMPSALGRSGGGGIGDMFLQHGEKLGFLVFVLLGGWLMWGGVSSLLTKRPTSEMLPSAISSKAQEAEAHVRQSTPLPEEKRTSSAAGQVAGQLAAWTKPNVAPPGEFVVLNKPLFNAFEKRTKPDVFPIEDLHVESGLAVLPKPGAGGPGFGGMSGFGGMGGFGSGMGGPMGMGPGGFGGDPGAGEEGIAGEEMGFEDSGLESGEGEGFGGEMGEGFGEGEFGGFGGFPGRGGMRPGGFGPPGMMGRRGPDRTPGTVVPYVVVTGLVPYGKQMTEYEVRYGQSSFRDPERDSPKWSQFLVERAEDDGSGNLNWERINTNAVAEKASREWAGLQPELLPMDCLLSFDVPELARSGQPVSPYAYNMPLPRRLDQQWGAEAVHPWFQGFLEKRRDEQQAMQRAMGQGPQGGRMSSGMGGMMGSGMMGSGMGSSMGSGMMGSGMGSSMGSSMMGSSMGSGMRPGRMGSSMGSGMSMGMGMEGEGSGLGGGSIFTEEGDGADPGGEMMGGEMMGEGGQMFAQPAPVEYRLFRFIDTDVRPGKTYRYRVRVSLWNPNIKLHPQYLKSEDVATPTKLASEPSEASNAIQVPPQSLLLARTLDRTEARKVRGLVETLVLGADPETGNFALRSISLDRGGMAIVAEKGERGTEGPPITTDSMLVDVAGTQEKPDDRRRDDDSRVPEPLDLLFMQPDGTLQIVSAADSERRASQYTPTLGADSQQDDRTQGPGRRGPPGFGPGSGGGSSPFGSGGPFGGGGGSSPFGGGGSSPFGGGGSGPGGGYGGGETP